ncbi:MAG: hypothetical protein ACPGVA_01460 [Pikeienuella sp.]
MEQLKTLATLAEQRKRRDLATLATLQMQLEAIEAKIRALRENVSAEASKIASASLPAQQIYAKYLTNAQRQMANAVKEQQNLTRQIADARQIALRSFGRTRAVEILTTAARRDLMARSARKEESILIPQKSTPPSH